VFYANNGEHLLEVTGLLGGTTAFAVRVIDNNSIELYYEGKTNQSPVVVLKRVS
jgi:hypothetical protein